VFVYSLSKSGYAIVMAEISYGGNAVLHLSGEIDLPACELLTGAAERLSHSRTRHVVVDLADVTFAGSALLNFLGRLECATDGATIVLRRPSAAARLVLGAVPISNRVTIEEGSPIPVQPTRASVA
jgi:anti-anti-sigma regulatory factor